MYWAIIFSAVALFLVFEAIIPFISPQLWRKMLIKVTNHSDQTMRRMGFIGLLLGTVIMMVVHSVNIT